VVGEHGRRVVAISFVRGWQERPSARGQKG
jgi:hypothetical protein